MPPDINNIKYKKTYNMKKTYLTPASLQLNIMSEGLLAASDYIKIADEEATGTQWSQKHDGWNSESWTEAE